MKKLMLGLLIALAISASAAAQKQKVITVSTWGGPNHGINTIVWPTWKKWIEEATEQRVTLKVVHDMGPPAAQMELVADGIADASWIFHGHMPGRFELTQLPEFPTFKPFSSEVASAAYWVTHQKYLAASKEHRDVEVMAVGVHGPGQVFVRDGLSRLTELNGKRLRVGGGVMSDVAQRLGVVGIALPPTGTYEAGAQGVIDGAMLTLEGLRSFRVAEVMPTTVTVPGGFYRGSFAIVMNPAVWKQISAEARKAIEQVSGERLARLFGYMMDAYDQRGVDFAKEKGNKFVELPAEDVQKLKEMTADLPKAWAKKIGQRAKVEEALAYFLEQLEVAAKQPSVAAQTIEVRL